MKSTLRNISIVLAIILNAPVVLVALFVSLVNVVNIHANARLIRLGFHLDSSMYVWPVIWLLWWLGLFGALRLCIAMSRGETKFLEIWRPVALFCVGLIGIVMFELQSAKSPTSRLMPIGLEAVPYVSLVALGAALRTIANFRWSGP